MPAAFGGPRFPLWTLSQAELAACRPQAVVHLHLTDRTLHDQHGVVRTADGPLTLDQLRRWLTDTDAQLTIRPVLDPAALAAVDSYEIPVALRRAMQIRHPGSVWPFSPATTTTTGGHLDLDHTPPYRKHGPPGQTGLGTLGPVARPEHNGKTHGGWQARQPDPGTYLWRSPHGFFSITTNQGTLLLGDTPWTHTLWHTAGPTLEDQTSA